MERLVVYTVATTVPKLHWRSPMEPIWRLRWSGGDEVGATSGHVDQQLEDDDGHYVDLQSAGKSDKFPYSIKKY